MYKAFMVVLGWSVIAGVAFGGTDTNSVCTSQLDSCAALVEYDYSFVCEPPPPYSPNSCELVTGIPAGTRLCVFPVGNPNQTCTWHTQISATVYPGTCKTDLYGQCYCDYGYNQPIYGVVGVCF